MRSGASDEASAKERAAVNVEVNPQSVSLALPRRSRPGGRCYSFLALVLAPTLIALAYMLLVAKPQYVTEFRYSVYNESNPETNKNELASGMSSAAALNADYVVADYLESRQAVEDLRRRFNLGQMFRPQGFDPVFKFWWDNGTIERLQIYWYNWVSTVEFDQITRLGRVQVRAFTAQDSLHLSLALVELSEKVVNDMMQRPRQDAIRFAEETVDRAKKRLQDALKAEETFRDQHRTLAPTHPAEASETLVAALRQSLSTMNAQFTALSKSLAPTAPSLMLLKSQIAATQQEVEKVEGRLGGRNTTTEAPENLPGELGAFDYLEREWQFAASTLNAMQNHLEQVRFDAEVQHQYLQVHMRPSPAQEARYPRPILWTALVFVMLSALWMIGTLLYFSMRDHTA
jgi:capsular polysaccharide transport system permease protein